MTKMEIKLRALSTFNKQAVEQNISNDLVLGSTSGIQCRCDPATLEIVIDGQAVKVAKIRELLRLAEEIKNYLDLYYTHWNINDAINELNKLINNLEDKDNG